MRDQEIRDRISAIERKRKLAKKLSTLYQEQIDRIIRGSTSSAKMEEIE